MKLSDATALKVGSRAVTAAYLGTRPVWSSAVTPAWSPAELFAAGEQGLWFDPSDMATMFQDSAGATPVTAMEQPVGRILDKSGRGNHASQATSTRRPVLSARYNILTGTDVLASQTVTTLATSYTLRFGGTGSVTLSGTKSGTYSAGVHEIVCTAGTLTVTVTGSVTTADMRTSAGTGMPTYQRVTTSTDYDTAGFAPYLKFDGADDRLETVSTDMSASDSMLAVCGLRKMLDATGMVFETSTSVDSVNGTLAMLAPSSAGTNSYRAYSRGSSQSVAGTGVFAAAPDRSIISVQAKIRSAYLLLRRNGADVELSTVNQGNVNFGNYPVFIGNRSAISMPFNGHMYGIILRGGVTDGSALASAEAWMNDKMKAY